MVAQLLGSGDVAHLLNACASGNQAFVGGGRRADTPGANVHSLHCDLNRDALPYRIEYWIALARRRLAVTGRGLV
jgi:metal-dependent amidase/aminoacylase/carboxypeptidase family protein